MTGRSFVAGFFFAAGFRAGAAFLRSFGCAFLAALRAGTALRAGAGFRGATTLAFTREATRRFGVALAAVAALGRVAWSRKPISGRIESSLGLDDRELDSLLELKSELVPDTPLTEESTSEACESEGLEDLELEDSSKAPSSGAPASNVFATEVVVLVGIS